MTSAVDGPAFASLATLNQVAQRVGVFGAPRDLWLLHCIQVTLDSLKQERQFIEHLSDVVKKETVEIKNLKVRESIDNDGSASKKLLDAQRSLKTHHDRLRERCESARMDIRLTEDDDMVEEFSKTIVAVAELHNDINEARLAIALHNVKHSKIIGEFNSIEKLKEFLDA